MPETRLLFSIGGCPVCQNSGDVLVLRAIGSETVVFYCPACGTAWDYPPDPHELNEVRSLSEVAPSGARLPTEEEVASLKLTRVIVVNFDLWASALREIIKPEMPD